MFVVVVVIVVASAYTKFKQKAKSKQKMQERERGVGEERAKKMTVATVLRERFDLGPVLWHGKRNEAGGAA